HLGALQRFFEQGGKRFRHEVSLHDSRLHDRTMRWFLGAADGVCLRKVPRFGCRTTSPVRCRAVGAKVDPGRLPVRGLAMNAQAQ
ncbi:MAG: hypothetical protein ACO258_07105, partial [Burkholderiaceae bacterium]